MRLFGIPVATLIIAAVALSWASGNDMEIARRITERLQREHQLGNLRGFNIDLTVAEGKVSLTGQVSSSEHSELVEEIAAEIAGVRKVDNHLVVKDHGEREPANAEALPPIPAEREESAPAASAACNILWWILNWLFPKLPDKDHGEREPVDAEDPPPVGAEVEEAKSTAREAYDIVRDITEQLAEGQQAGKLRGFNINLKFDKGTVILIGHVSNRMLGYQTRPVARILLCARRSKSPTFPPWSAHDFFDVLAKTALMIRSTFSLPHFGHFTPLPRSCSWKVSFSVNVLRHSVHL